MNDLTDLSMLICSQPGNRPSGIPRALQSLVERGLIHLRSSTLQHPASSNK